MTVFLLWPWFQLVQRMPSDLQSSISVLSSETVALIYEPGGVLLVFNSLSYLS